jgi:hypothetical protein
LLLSDIGPARIKAVKLQNKPRNRDYPVGRHRQRLQKLLANLGFKIDLRDMAFMDANQFVGRIGPSWVTKAIDPRGREVSLCGRFRMRELCGPLLVMELAPYEFEVFLRPKWSEQL